MASVVKIKRSSIQGKAPSLSSLQIGELALNVRDGKLFSANSTAVFEVGANVEQISTGRVHFPNTAIVSSNNNLTFLLDADNNNSSSSLTVKKNTNTGAGGSELFKINENGEITFNNAYTFPNADGGQDFALKTDGSGTLSFGPVISSDDIDDILSRNQQVTSNVIFNSTTTANNLFVEGDLVIRGNVTTISSEELNIDTNFIVLNANLTPSIGPLLDAGIEINRGSSANTKFFWDESLNRWKFTYGESAQYDVKIPVTLHDVLDNGFASNNNITLNGTSNFANAVIDKLNINNQYDFPQSYGDSGYVLASYGNGTLYWVASNNELRTSTEFSTFRYTANTGQTLINGNDDQNELLRYEIGRENVFLNGIRVVGGVDYTATSGTSIVFTDGLANGDIVTIDSFGYTPDLQFGTKAILTSKNLTTSTLGVRTVDSFSDTDFKSAQYYVEASNSTSVHTTTVNLAQVGGNVYLTEYGTIITGPSMMTLDADNISGTVSLKATPTSVNMAIKTFRVTFKA